MPRALSVFFQRSACNHLNFGRRDDFLENVKPPWKTTRRLRSQKNKHAIVFLRGMRSRPAHLLTCSWVFGKAQNKTRDDNTCPKKNTKKKKAHVPLQTNMCMCLTTYINCWLCVFAAHTQTTGLTCRQCSECRIQYLQTASQINAPCNNSP